MERRQAILTTVRAHGAASIHELARLTGSSEVTVRRDLRILEVEGQLSRLHGGAVALGGSVPMYARSSSPSSASLCRRMTGGC